MEYSILAPAKVNLYLDVLSKRNDGYHEIKSVMQAVSIYDEINLSVLPSEQATINLYGNNENIKWDETNLVYKACKLFLDGAKIKGHRLDIQVNKRIPVCAGMAGGSTDAAGTLILLNKAFGMPFSVEKLCSLGSLLGADVPFCIMSGTCLCEGTGDIVNPIPSFCNKYMVCAIDSSSVSTPKAYSLLDDKYGTDCKESMDIRSFISCVKSDDLHGVCASLYNKFESVIIPQNPNIQRIKDILIQNGALGALMSGSGPSVFAIFETEFAQKNAFKALENEKIRAFLCKSL